MTPLIFHWTRADLTDVFDRGLGWQDCIALILAEYPLTTDARCIEVERIVLSEWRRHRGLRAKAGEAA